MKLSYQIPFEKPVQKKRIFPIVTTCLGKYSLTISPSSPCMRYVQLVCGGYQCATDKKMPSESPEALRLSEDSSQSQVPFLLPAVSTWPGQLPTLKWNPVFNRGPGKTRRVSGFGAFSSGREIEN